MAIKQQSLVPPPHSSLWPQAPGQWGTHTLNILCYPLVVALLSILCNMYFIIYVHLMPQIQCIWGVLLHVYYIANKNQVIYIRYYIYRTDRTTAVTAVPQLAKVDDKNPTPICLFSCRCHCAFEISRPSYSLLYLQGPL